MSRSKWKKIGAFGGIAFVILQLTSQALFQYGGAEPAFNASSQEILEFFMTRNRLFFDIGGYLSVLSFIAFLWFLGSLWATLREGEGDPAWLSWISAASGILMLVTTTTTGVG